MAELVHGTELYFVQQTTCPLNLVFLLRNIFNGENLGNDLSHEQLGVDVDAKEASKGDDGGCKTTELGEYSEDMLEVPLVLNKVIRQEEVS